MTVRSFESMRLKLAKGVFQRERRIYWSTAGPFLRTVQICCHFSSLELLMLGWTVKVQLASKLLLQSLPASSWDRLWKIIMLYDIIIVMKLIMTLIKDKRGHDDSPTFSVIFTSDVGRMSKNWIYQLHKRRLLSGYPAIRISWITGSLNILHFLVEGFLFNGVTFAAHFLKD